MNLSFNSPRALAATTDSRVYDFLAQGPAARTEISSSLGISKPTAAQAIVRLQRFGLVSEGIANAQGKRGRIPERYAPRAEFGHVLAVDLQAQRLAVRAGDLTGNVLADRFCPLQPHTGRQDVLQMLGALLEEVDRLVGSPRLATGISQAAPVLHDEQGNSRVLDTEIFSASSADLAAQFDPETTLLDNDVNWMAVAEYGGRSGAMMLLYLGAGIGSSLVIDAQVYRGRHGLVGELENQRLDGATLLEHLRAAGLVEGRILFERLSDPSQWPGLLDPLSRVLGNLLGYLDPDCVVVTGPGASAALSDRLAARLADTVPLASVPVQYSAQAGMSSLDGALAGARAAALDDVWRRYSQ